MTLFPEAAGGYGLSHQIKTTLPHKGSLNKFRDEFCGVCLPWGSTNLQGLVVITYQGPYIHGGSAHLVNITDVTLKQCTCMHIEMCAYMHAYMSLYMNSGCGL